MSVYEGPYAVTSLGEVLGAKTITAVWYAEVNATSGTVSAPAGGTLIADRFATSVDALCSTITTTLTPDLEAATEADETPVLVSSFTVGTGAFVLSGTPSAYPVAVIFAYTIPLLEYDSAKDLTAVDLDEVGGGGGGGGLWEPVDSLDVQVAIQGFEFTGLDFTVYDYKLHGVIYHNSTAVDKLRWFCHEANAAAVDATDYDYNGWKYAAAVSDQQINANYVCGYGYSQARFQLMRGLIFTQTTNGTVRMTGRTTTDQTFPTQEYYDNLCESNGQTGTADKVGIYSTDSGSTRIGVGTKVVLSRRAK